MNGQYVTIERRGRVAVVRFDRGVRPNPLSHALMRELTEAARSFENDHETAAIVLTGRAESFCMGMDLRDPELAAAREAPLAERRLLVQTGPRMCQAWEDVEPITIAAIEGWCVGGGVALAVSTDLRVAGRSTTFYVPEVERGMNLGWGAVPRIVNLVGPARAKRLIALCEQRGAEDAERWGLIDEVTDDGKALDRALELAERAASLPPVPVRMVKRGIDAAAKALNHTAAALDADQFALAQTSEDYVEGLQSFLEKRPPRYTGR